MNLTLKANPNYELILYDRLPPSQQECLQDLLKDEDFYGILRPIDSTQTGLGVKSVCQNTALLYLTLQQGSAVPTYLKKRYQEKTEEFIYQLVIDNIIEVENQGKFVSGIEAIPLFSFRHQIKHDELLGTGKIAQLSLDALKYAQVLAIDDSSKLSARLYFYNRLPITPKLLRLYPSKVEIADYLQISPHHPAGKLLLKHWREATSTQGDDFWRTWKYLENLESLNSQEKATYKLYISPSFEVLGEVFPSLVKIFTELQVPQFKVGGKQIAGLLRSDKIIAYFGDFDSLKKTADLIMTSLPNIPSQGVPFTSELDENGLLSWGIDPPSNDQVLKWQERESWRVWLTNRLATGLLSAKNTDSSLEAWQFALYRLQQEGVDPKTWQPLTTL
ncbi:hypothetical protein [Crocosphaera sp. XPORK-15E]|uniref:hypothetical protein n=1 Tax=Crocosphaera sp. XPORK-15E TaxID=3110247 RepID=UPI002B1F16F3|nr:hypothetical protein [Crocosphaera sp. XPORK-15E]MEA5536898.1 hypothetical protein [Crocosphaera sp. XPORK-15E]